MKVLIGVDGSTGGFAAVRLAGRMLDAQRDAVLLYYAPPDLSWRSGAAATPEILQRARHALTDTVFAEARRQLPKPLGEAAQTIIGEQKPHQGVLAAADEHRADLVVVGARGAGPIEGLTLGSVGRAVVHHATIPVLIARPRPGAAPADKLRVLLACDGSDASKEAAAALSKFTWPEGAIGRVITVVESMLVGHVPEWLQEQARDVDTEAMARAWVEEHQQEKKQAHDRLVAYCPELPEIFHNQEPLVAEGHPSEEILKAVEATRCDLVAVGARGLGFVSRLILGSTSEKLLARAPCSLLIVREHRQP